MVHVAGRIRRNDHHAVACIAGFDGKAPLSGEFHDIVVPVAENINHPLGIGRNLIDSIERIVDQTRLGVRSGVPASSVEPRLRNLPTIDSIIP